MRRHRCDLGLSLSIFENIPLRCNVLYTHLSHLCSIWVHFATIGVIFNSYGWESTVGPLSNSFMIRKLTQSHGVSKFVGALIILSALADLAAQPTVIISEFMAANDAVLKDPTGKYADWIELHNFGNTPVKLDGLYLTDSKKNAAKFPLPSETIEPGGYWLLWAKGKVSNEASEGASFRLSVKGDYLALVDRDGRTIIQDFGKEYPDQQTNVSYGVTLDWRKGKALIEYSDFLRKPTPGEANVGPLLGSVKTVVLSEKRNFYEEPFELSLRSKTMDAVIRYTIDGSEPKEESGMVYEEPISIAKTTVIRVRAFKAGYLPSKLKTHSYLFAADVAHQSPDGLPAEGFPYTWGRNRVDYGMDPRVIEDPRFSDQFVDGLKSLPSISVVTDVAHLFGDKTGVYSNPGQQGREWERPCSIELINPKKKDGFQIDAGVRIRGGFSRDLSNPKHAFRFFFRDVYGPSKLKYPLFGKHGAQEFDNIDLRTFQNYSWSFEGDPRGIFIRDQFNRDLQLAMGQPAARGEFYHLFLNGQYWGIYNTCERAEASYGENYFGGDKTEYDAIKVDSGRTVRRATYTLVPTDGDMKAWRKIYDIVEKGLDENENYFALLGRNPEGLRDPEMEVFIDDVNLITYMMIIFYGGNLDAPISMFGGNQTPNNWHGVRRRDSDQGFRFFVWDAEHTFLNVNENRVGPFDTGRAFERTSPQWLWEKALENAEFRMTVADHIYKLFFNGGLLSPASMSKAFLHRAEELETAVVCESARWGDASGRGRGRAKRVEGNSGPLNQLDWKAEVKRIVENYIPQRSDVVLGQLYSQGVWPDIMPPTFNRLGGKVERGYSFEAQVESDKAKIYVTFDGTDPRLVGGEISGRAIEFSSPVAVNVDTIVKARSYFDGDWSALSVASYELKK